MTLLIFKFLYVLCSVNIIGTGTKGFIALDFIREAPSAYDAISSAINDVRKAIPQAEIMEVSPNFVGVTDVAKLLGCSRQNQDLLSKSISDPPLLSTYPLPGSFLTFVRAIARKPPNLNPPLMILKKIRVLSRRIRYILSRVGKFSSVETVST
ncbi:hypothetical protein NWP22_07940 [Anabaenopsis tanganyikae CS-531]|uniref:Uncharacterized protein n=1 Tax=Anabaenopsis tanganyikae CS-531 TaxID=2785304 RepID=A0ABT6KD49_9CYAN|nr:MULTISPECIES: hypothetical protein [Anabaenopsis]MDH6093013.1 hypothetical protein [Anabaenopsis arnoldii]MDH6105795.1 hypothetical protein [Anabaenopsis tanganyikae CS-531]